MNGNLKILLLSLASASAFMTNLVVAQSAGDRKLAIDEVIVTAQKREQNLMEVPISVSAYAGEKLDQVGIRELSDFLQTAPGVTLNGENTDLQVISIRGLNPSFGDPAVGYYLDEMSWAKLGNADVPDVRTYDLERVEVLRGPQGTLYGGGSIGGVVRILTRDPVLDEFQAQADVTGSATSDSDDTNSALKGAVNIPLGDKVALRVSGTYESIAGWIDSSITGADDVNGRDAETYRGKLRFAPNDDLDIVLGFSNYRSDGAFTPSYPDFTTDRELNTYATDYDISSLTVDYSLGGVQMTSATALMDYMAVAAAPFALPPLGTFFLGTVDNQDLFSQEFRFASPIDGKFYWTSGVYYREIERAATGALPPFFAFGQSETSKSYAVFGEGTWRFLDDRLDATLGLRYFNDERHQVDTVTGLPPVDGKFDTVSPRFNVAYRPNDDWMVYTNVGRGFRSGLTQAAASIFAAAQFGIVAPASIDPETAWSYEVGAKGTLFDGRLSIEAAAYHIDWKDLQLTVQPDPDIPSAAFLINAGDASSRGFEAGVVFRATAGLTLEGGFSIIDPVYEDDIASPGISIVKGQPIANVPDLTWNASALYQGDLTDSLSGFARVGIQNVGEKSSSTGLVTSEVRTFIDARVGIQSRHWGAYLFCTNLTDDDTPLGAVADPNGITGRSTPRTIGFNLRHSY